MERVYNFSAGPSTLPETVLERAASEMLNYGGSGMSVMEMSHRSSVYQSIIDGAEANLRELLSIPDNYKVLFLQGGASLQFAMIPLNLMTGTKKIDAVCTGVWAKKAISEAKKFGTVNVVASSEASTFNHIPEIPLDKLSDDADYFYYTSNNTIYGTRFATIPEVGDKVIVSDMSSDILSQPVDVSKFGLIFAGAQKNMGPAGLTVVIIREDLIGKAESSVPTMLQYATHASEGSMYNTPPTYSIYVAGLVFEWIKNLGGLEAMKAINEKKANMIYDYLDNSNLFSATVRKEDRSIMNIPFVTGNEAIDKAFISFAQKKGLVNLSGHRSVGGMRASVYNAMPIEGVEALVNAMKEFEAQQ